MIKYGTYLCCHALSSKVVVVVLIVLVDTSCCCCSIHCCVVVHGSHMVNVSGGNGGGGRDLHWRVNNVVVVGDGMVALSLVSVEFPLIIIIIIVLLKVYGGISAHGSQGCQRLPQPLEFPIRGWKLLCILGQPS